MKRTYEHYVAKRAVPKGTGEGKGELGGIRQREKERGRELRTSTLI